MFRHDIPAFEPAIWLRSGNLQTIASAFRKVPAESNRTCFHRIPTTLGDELALHQMSVEPATEKTTDSRQVLMLHGLGGSSRSGYMARVCQKLAERGVSSWRLDARGAGAGTELARYHHHAGRAEDVQAAVEFIISQHPRSPLTIIGFSLGGNVLLKWMGSEHAIRHSNVDSAIAVAPPIDLRRCSAGMKTGLSRIYDRYFARVMMQRVRERLKARPDMVNPPIRFAPSMLDQFDRQFTAPAGGFDSLDDYYDTASSWYQLMDIKTPTLLVVDELDPVIPFEIFREELYSDAIQVCRTRGGGHIGYYGQPLEVDADRHWLDWRIVDWVVGL